MDGRDEMDEGARAADSPPPGRALTAGSLSGEMAASGAEECQAFPRAWLTCASVIRRKETR